MLYKLKLINLDNNFIKRTNSFLAKVKYIFTIIPYVFFVDGES